MSNDKSAEEIVRGRIDAIKARCEAATPGPWRDIERGNSVISHGVVTVAYDGMPQQNICAGISPKTGNAAIIAHSREDIPYLLGLVDSRAAEIAELRGRLDEETSRRYQAECNYDHWKTTCEHLQAQLTASQQRERAAVEDLVGAGACFSCEHFRRNGGDCFGAGRCRLDGIEIWPCNEPGVYRAAVPDDGRKTYKWRGPQEAGEEQSHGER